MKATTNKSRKLSPSEAAEGLARLVVSEPASGWVFPVKDKRPKGIPREGGILAFVDAESLTVQVVSREERAALKAQFRQTAPGLSVGEYEALHRGGATAAELKLGPALWALARRSSGIKYQALLKGSLSVEQAARRLRLTSGRLRQLLVAGRLYGVKVGTDWRIPAFQFQGKELVPGIGTVVAKLRREPGLLAIYNWFTAPNPDLRTEVDAEDAFTPLDWLRSGHPPEQVASLAAEL